MTVWHLQHHHAGDDMLEVPLGWTFGAIVSDCDMISKSEHVFRRGIVSAFRAII